MRSDEIRIPCATCDSVIARLSCTIVGGLVYGADRPRVFVLLDKNRIQSINRAEHTFASMTVVEDPKAPFPGYFVRYKTKTEQRMFVAFHAYNWLRYQYKRGSAGAIMVDIDDTLIDGNESVHHGFQYMKELYNQAGIMFPLHIVTARPRDDHHIVMKMLSARGFCVPPDRLHMLPTDHYGKDTKYVEDFKWKTCMEISRLHHGVVARFGDKLWDCAHIKSLRDDLSHISDKDCYIFRDPRMKGCISYKLPGV